jgi:pilus assembly protein CpaC
MFSKHVLFFLALALILPSTVTLAQQQQQRREIVLTPERAVQPTRSLTLPVNKSQVFKVNQAIGKIAVGNADVADAVALSADSFYVYGKKAGSTNVSVYGQESQLLAVLDVTVGADLEAVKKALHDVLPHDTVSVRAVNDTIALSGSVNSPAKVSRALEVAKQFVERDRTVINDMRVTGTQQVMLQVKVAEMQRNVTKSLGFRPFLNIGKPGNPAGFALASADPVSNTGLTNFALAAGTAISGNFAFRELIDLLEQKGTAKILAEPNLVAMSGDTANFLAGGEFPIPVAYQPTTAAGTLPQVTIEFKQFGVALSFTPTVVDTDLINLVVAPEVSQLDKADAFISNGFAIPAINTRRARTTVEVRDGQSFAIAGLISSDFQDTIRGIPGLADVPVIGALARSAEYQRNETELVIIVTPKLVQPAPADTLVAPTDSFVPPSDTEIFLNGRTENPDSGLPRATSGGGLTGKYGHIIR